MGEGVNQFGEKEKEKKNSTDEFLGVSVHVTKEGSDGGGLSGESEVEEFQSPVHASGQQPVLTDFTKMGDRGRLEPIGQKRVFVLSPGSGVPADD